MPDLRAPACQNSFAGALSSILLEESEPPAVAARLGTGTVQDLLLADLGPRPFEVQTNYPADYYFIVISQNSQCVLKLFGRTRNDVKITGTLTLASRPLPGCLCPP